MSKPTDVVATEQHKAAKDKKTLDQSPPKKPRIDAVTEKEESSAVSQKTGEDDDKQDEENNKSDKIIHNSESGTDNDEDKEVSDEDGSEDKEVDGEGSDDGESDGSDSIDEEELSGLLWPTRDGTKDSDPQQQMQNLMEDMMAMRQENAQLVEQHAQKIRKRKSDDK